VMELELSADQLAAGGRLTVPTIGGEMGIDVPQGAKPGQVVEMPGMGFKDTESGRRGVQRVTLRRAG
jgi:DnaJ-class molecular chaperone